MRLCLFLVAFSWYLLTAQAQRNQTVSVESLKQQLTQARHDTTRLRLCATIARHYYNQNRFDSLYSYVQQGMRILSLSRAPSPHHVSNLYHYLALYYRHRGFYQQGIASIKQAIHYAQQARDSNQTASCQYTLAMIYSDANKWQQAVNQIGINLKYIQDRGLDELLTDNYLLIIELFKELKNEPMRELYTNRFMALANQHESPQDLTYAYGLKGEMLAEKGHLNEAGATFRKALRWARLTNNTLYVTDIMTSLGTIYRNQGRYQAAKQIFNQTFAIAQSFKNSGDMAVSKREIALVYLAEQQPKEALHQARYAVQFARQNKTARVIIPSLDCLGKALVANSLYQEALTVYQEQHRLKEEKYTEKNLQQIAQMQAQFETENKEKTIKILQKTAQINQLNLLRQQQQLSQSQRNQVTSAIIIILLFLLIGVIFFFLRRSQQAYSVLQQTTQALSEANEVKNKLFSVIGHDLRSPIASMKMTILQAQTDDVPASTPVMNRLKRQVDNVLDLLTNLLDWSLIQLKGYELNQEPLHLYNIIEETLSQAGDQLEEKHLGLVNQVAKTHIVLGNKHQLRAVVRNLVNNAIKFTPLGGYIRLRSVERESYIELSIQDSGVGMSAEQLARLLSAPEIRSGTMGEKGTGLGLRISRELVERQGGNLYIESRPQGGTLVKVRLLTYAKRAPSHDSYKPVRTGAQSHV